jgi:hypothetical protein
MNHATNNTIQAMTNFLFMLFPLDYTTPRCAAIGRGTEDTPAAPGRNLTNVEIPTSTDR